ncbi:GNAT family N-acetyltransferase [Ornithinibacillus californiensis]|uniref:GNAT family N-acetyltransferase n=1 Tax=Ornithinibacillus californiensis TaxID=161536 RepID=UPI00069EFB36|nr:GNAT family N-acetyltransferase [Ornithinibacillus californiensis]
MLLRPITMEDYPTVLAWSMDEVFCSHNGWERNRDPDELYQWWRYCVENKAEDFVRLAIEWDGRLVGYADLVIQDSDAEIGIAIGRSSSWGRGIGSQAD